MYSPYYNEEVWVDIIDFPGYQVSNTGKVRNMKDFRLLGQQLNTNGYYTVNLRRNLERKATVPIPHSKHSSTKKLKSSLNHDAMKINSGFSLEDGTNRRDNEKKKAKFLEVMVPGDDLVKSKGELKIEDLSEIKNDELEAIDTEGNNNYDEKEKRWSTYINVKEPYFELANKFIGCHGTEEELMILINVFKKNQKRARVEDKKRNISKDFQGE